MMKKFAGFLGLVLCCVLTLPASAQEEVTPNEETAVPVLAPAVSLPPYAVDALSPTPAPVGDYVVGPGRTEVVVRAGESVTRNITVANRIADGRVFQLEVEDMVGSVDDVTKALVLLGAEEGPYSVKDFISFPADIFTLDLNTRATIPVTITIPPNTEPGGYYGAVLVSTADPSQVDEGQVAKSPIVARIGSLFFITVPGEIETAGNLKDFSFKNNKFIYASGPIDLGVVFENTGSIHLNPYGELRVTNIFGREVGYVELDPWFVLPKSLRLREITWHRDFLFGRYTFSLAVNRGYDDLVDEATVVAWVIPWSVVLTTFGVIFVLILIIRLFTRTFELKRKK